MKNYNKLRIIANKLNEIFEQDIYLVGGSVRDIVLGLKPKDFDFTTSILPDEIESILISKGIKPYIVGKRFGTVGFKLQIEEGKKHELIEITTFRYEKYETSRKPEVTFSLNLDEDLIRRDFTINAMAINIKSLLDITDNISYNVIIDPYKGLSDLQNKVIKCVGNPDKRFKEDPLRLLRAIRFASKYHFCIEYGTFNIIKEKAHRLLLISKERIVEELDKIITFPDGLAWLEMTGLLTYIIPELTLQFGLDQNNPYHKLTLWEHTKKVVNSIPNDNLDLKWAGLLHDIGKPFVKVTREDGISRYIKHDILGADISDKLLRHLKFSNIRREYIVDIIKNHQNENSILKYYDNLGKE